jgi:hypothetical protein
LMASEPKNLTAIRLHVLFRGLKCMKMSDIHRRREDVNDHSRAIKWARYLSVFRLLRVIAQSPIPFFPCDWTSSRRKLNPLRKDFDAKSP